MVDEQSRLQVDATGHLLISELGQPFVVGALTPKGWEWLCRGLSRDMWWCQLEEYVQMFPARHVAQRACDKYRRNKLSPQVLPLSTAQQIWADIEQERTPAP